MSYVHTLETQKKLLNLALENHDAGSYLGSNVINMFTAFADRIRSVIDEATTYFDRAIDDIKNDAEDIQRPLAFNIPKEVNYMYMTDIVVPVPAGLQARYEALLSYFDRDFGAINEFNQKTLNPTTTLLSNILNRPQLLQGNLNILNTHSISLFTSIIADGKKDLADLYASGSTTTEKKFSDVFGSLREYTESASKARHLYDKIKALDNKKTQSLIAEIAELTDHVVGMIKANPDTIKITSAMCEQLSSLLYSVAKVVEFSGIYQFSANTAIKTMVQIENKVNSVYK